VPSVDIPSYSMQQECTLLLLTLLCSCHLLIRSVQLLARQSTRGQGCLPAL
jgi:hypothetical protein